jgi:hypothetical protein
MDTEKTSTDSKASSPVKTLKDLNIGLCLGKELEYDELGDLQISDDRYCYITNELEKRSGNLVIFEDSALDEIQRHSPPIDVLITNVTPSSDTRFRERATRWRKTEAIGEETFWFSEYSDSLRRIAKIDEMGIPVIAYTGAPPHAVELFEKIALFKSVILKTDYYHKDLDAIEKVTNNLLPDHRES